MEKLLPNLDLYVGGDSDYLRIAHRAGWSALRCAKYGPGCHQDILQYHTLPAPDGPNRLWVRKGNLLALNLLDLDDPWFVDPDMMERGLDFIDERLKAGDKVLVSCNQGQSRGPTTALLYLRRIGEMPYHFVSAERVFKTLYPPYSPAMGMRVFARQHWS